MEIYLHDQWGTICDDLWDIREANVVCTQLGFLDAISAVSGAEFGEGTGPTLLDDMQCIGNESALSNCSARPIKQHNCNHSKDAGVRCNPCQLRKWKAYTYILINIKCFIILDQQIQLVNGLNSKEGRVEVRIGCHGNWSTVCSDYWDNVAAEVACHQLGYDSDGSIAYSSATFGQGNGTILLNNLQCTGKENNLFECKSDRNTLDCGHSQDAGVLCPCKQIITVIAYVQVSHS